jgi:hypothetical protein
MLNPQPTVTPTATQSQSSASYTQHETARLSANETAAGDYIALGFSYPDIFDTVPIDASEAEGAYFEIVGALNLLTKKTPAALVKKLRESADEQQRRQLHEAAEIAAKIKPAAQTANHTREARRLAATIKKNPPAGQPAYKPRFKLEKLSEILKQPRPTWLIQDLLLRDTTSLITADYATYKTFAALDIALCVATGTPFHGMEVKWGNVVYICAEGAFTMKDRVTAWLTRHHMNGNEPQNFDVLQVPVQIADDDTLRDFISDIADLAPELVIIDTLARCNAGRDENAVEAMSKVVNAMGEIRAAFGCHVAAIHHNNKSGTARGSSSLPSDTDTHITLKKQSKFSVLFHCDKQKFRDFDDFVLVGREVDLGYKDEYGREVTSLIFEKSDVPIVPTISTKDKSRLELLEILQSAPSDGLTSGAWQARAFKDLGMAESTFKQKVKELKAQEIEKIGNFFRVKVK